MAGLLLAAIWPAAARAVELTDFQTADEAKKLTLTFTFDEVVDAEVVHHYAGNYVEIVIEGLNLPRKLTNKVHYPESEETRQFLQDTRFYMDGSTAHIRLEIGKYADPGDVQVVELDEKIVADMVKPFYKLPKDDTPAEPVVEEAPPAEFIPDEPGETEPAGETETTSGEEFFSNFEAAGDNGETGQPAGETTPVVTEDETVTDDPGFGSLDDLRDDAEEVVEGRPVRDLQPTPSYRNFDLDDVPVAQLQLRNMPFNEALMELTAGSGFNVVVGEGVSDELMTLDFRQKELSLKRALDLLCMAYDLSYSVEDDAIVIRGK